MLILRFYFKDKNMQTEINGFKIVHDYGYTKNKLTRWARVECKICKREYDTVYYGLKHRNHCGCSYRKDGKKLSNYAKSHPRLRNCLKAMITRCHSSKDSHYYCYGAVGIFVCDDWKENTDRFCEWALANGYEDNLTIDRIDNSQGYFPENCRWVTKADQNRNKRNNVMSFELANKIRKEHGELSYRQLAIKYNVCKSTIGSIIQNISWKES